MAGQQKAGAGDPGDPGDRKPDDGTSGAKRAAKAVGAFLLLLASRLWAGLVRGWQELGRRDAADIAAARAAADAPGDSPQAADPPRRRSIFQWLPKRRSAVIALALLLLLLLWRCGHDGAPTGSRGGISGHTDVPACDGLLEHDTWVGRITYKHSRDVTDPDGRFRVRYAYDLDLQAEMVERTRRHDRRRDRDYLVQVFSPEPHGRIKAEQHLEEFDNGALASSYRFAATGGVQNYEDGMAETGSMMSLTVKDDCTYKVFLQAQALGRVTRYDYRGTETYDGMLSIPSVRGEGTAGNGSSISGTFELPLLSEDFLERNRNNPDWDAYHYILERSRVSEALGEDNLGTVVVTWHFEAKG